MVLSTIKISIMVDGIWHPVCTKLLILEIVWHPGTLFATPSTPGASAHQHRAYTTLGSNFSTRSWFWDASWSPSVILPSLSIIRSSIIAMKIKNGVMLTAEIKNLYELPKNHFLTVPAMLPYTITNKNNSDLLSSRCFFQTTLISLCGRLLLVKRLIPNARARLKTAGNQILFISWNRQQSFTESNFKRRRTSAEKCYTFKSHGNPASIYTRMQFCPKFFSAMKTTLKK